MTAPLVADEPGDVSDVAEIAGTRLEDGNWDIGVFLTDLPSRMERNPVSTEVDPEHRVALISLPALGSRRLRRRVRQTVAGVVRQQATQDEELLDSPIVGRPAPGEESRHERHAVRGLRGHVRLVLGMVRANRPWAAVYEPVPRPGGRLRHGGRRVHHRHDLAGRHGETLTARPPLRPAYGLDHGSAGLTVGCRNQNRASRGAVVTPHAELLREA
ncbi:hypothetical protein [Streptomyces mirabilis]|uniref:Uncharacterized protein n=1 Tax=Streptomyces mirabilis TaxID=68239 RepID=A0A1I2WDG7_9ACTN|nr:hypothetical protein [Streptomyces mirabilis]SFG98677.1 hypothetical protein SAMN02787118_13639 [Streptomyces mirabilis]